MVGIGALAGFVLLNSGPATSNTGTQAVTSKAKTTTATASTQSAEEREFAAEIGPIDSEGTIKCVKEYLLENVNDPTGLELVKWSGVAPIIIDDNDSLGCILTGAAPPKIFWGVRVKFRSKNGLGALVIQTCVFLIQSGKVVHMVDMDNSDWTVRVYANRRFPQGTFPGEGPLQHVETGKEQLDAITGLLRNPNGPKGSAKTEETNPAVPPPRIQFGPHTVAAALDGTTEPKPAAKSGVPVQERTAEEATKDNIRPGAWKPPGAERRPVPDQAARNAARAMIDKLHHDELASATTPLKKMELAGELWMEAATEAELRPGTATEYVLFQMSVDLAAAKRGL